MSRPVLAQITHILFDLDGLLVDTESCYVIAYNNVTKIYGKEFTWDVKAKCMAGAQWSHLSAHRLIQLLDLPLTVEQLEQLAYKQFLAVVSDVELMPGANELVRHLYDHSIPMAIATGSDRKHFDLKIAKHLDFFNKYFSYHVLASEDPNVKRSKPFPDIFIEAMKKFGPDVRPENVLVSDCIAIGDRVPLIV